MNTMLRWAMTKWASAAAVVTAVIAAPAPALACGGLFCSATNPVNQAAERIIFAADGETVTAVIEIQYEGPAELFSWVLPVPGVPQIAVSSKLALDRLQGRTNPQYILQTQFDPGCLVGRGGFGGASASAGNGGSGGGVVVLESGTVGPYDYEVIQVDSGLPDRVTVAVEWLDRNGYDVTGLGEDRLRPYLDDNLNLLAFRLTKDATAGSIRPVLISYESPNAMIPIRPTAVAANDDMGVMVWVLGAARAVPVNYRSLILNETSIDWFNPNNNYNDVVIAAADEAGGHGFVTEYADLAENVGEVVLSSSDRAFFEGLSPQQPLRELLEGVARYAAFDGLRDVFSEHVPLRPDVEVEAFLSCVSCYFVGLPEMGTVDDDPIFGTDATALLAEVSTDVIEPMAATQALFSAHPWLTRFYTTLSAGEMTADPVFDFNVELEAVSNIHTATRTVLCDSEGRDTGEWSANLPDGTGIRGSGTAWPTELAAGPANRLILQHGTTGEGVVVLDNSVEIQDLVDQNNGAFGGAGGAGSGGNAGVAADDDVSGGGCDCSMTRRPSSLLGAFGGALLALMALRRTTRRAR